MSASATRIRAGLALSGHALRYAEIDLGPKGFEAEKRGAARGPRLLRLGACDFDFDAAAAILDPAGPAHLDTIATAVREIFSASRADRLCVAVHPWNATSFFSPLAAGMPAADRFEQIRQEAAMLADARQPRPVRVTATPVRVETTPDGASYHWHHVLRLPEAVHARMDHVASRIGAGVPHSFVDSAGAAAAVAAGLLPEDQRRDDTDDPDLVPFALVVGGFGDRVEMALTRGETWFHSHWAEASDVTDSAYFGAALLDRLHVPRDLVRRLYLYGDSADRALVGGLEELLATETRPLDPLRLFEMARSQNDPLALASFAPCVGAALRCS
jgi:hypothetical protein